MVTLFWLVLAAIFVALGVAIGTEALAGAAVVGAALRSRVPTLLTLRRRWRAVRDRRAAGRVQ